MIVGFTVYFSGRYLAIAVLASQENAFVHVSRPESTLLIAGQAFFLMAIVGIYAALLDWRPGVYLMLVGFTDT